MSERLLCSPSFRRSRGRLTEVNQDQNRGQQCHLFEGKMEIKTVREMLNVPL